MCYRIETITILLKRYLNDEVQGANFSVDRAYPRDIDSIPVKSVCVEKNVYVYSFNHDSFWISSLNPVIITLFNYVVTK